MVRFAALGDSITLGMGDRLPDGSWRGWAALLAEALAPPDAVEFHNLATSGATAAHVVAAQLPAALAVRPQLASVIVGVNDTLRSTFDVARIGLALDSTVAALRAAGAQVLTARLPDPGLMLGLPRALAQPLGRRIRAVNAVADVVARRRGTLHLDCGALDCGAGDTVRDRRLWSVDRLHPSERGHRLLSAAYFDLLERDGFPVLRRPGEQPTGLEPTLPAQLRWMATKGTRWVLRRCTDLLPYLVWMAVAERWHGLRGAEGRLDAWVHSEIAAAVDLLSPSAERAQPAG